jgi:hypothetical protein
MFSVSLKTILVLTATNLWSNLTSTKSLIIPRTSLSRQKCPNARLGGPLKFLTLEVENYPVNWNEVDPVILEAEARCIFDHQQADLIRQIYFRVDTRSAVIEWESDSMDNVTQALAALPLVQANLIHFEIIPLMPYTGYKRLFK